MNSDPLDRRAPYNVSPPRYSVSHQMVTTAFELPNFHVRQTLGVVRGIVVRSRNVFATLGAAFQQVVGGNITIWTRMCEETRSDAFDIMIQHASEIGANAIIGVRYDTTEIATGVTSTLLSRAADVVLKEKRRLVLAVRETPLHVGHLRTLTTLAEIGAVIAPIVPALYNKPKSVDDIINHTVGRLLDLLGIETKLVKRWQGGPSED